MWYIRVNYNPGQAFWEWAIHQGIPLEDRIGAISNQIASRCEANSREEALLQALEYCQREGRIKACRIVF